MVVITTVNYNISVINLKKQSVKLYLVEIKFNKKCILSSLPKPLVDIHTYNFCSIKHLRKATIKNTLYKLCQFKWDKSLRLSTYNLIMCN